MKFIFKPTAENKDRLRDTSDQTGIPMTRIINDALAMYLPRFPRQMVNGKWVYYMAEIPKDMRENE